MSGRVAIFASHVAHVSMFAPVIHELARTNVAATVVSPDRLYGQGVSSAARNLDLEVIEVEAGGSIAGPGLFYRRFPAAVLRDVWRARSPVLAALAATGASVVAVGADNGPIERLVVHQARRLGLGTVLVQDGRLVASKPRVEGAGAAASRAAKSILSPLLRALGLPFLGASQYGSSGVNLICASGHESAILLSRRAQGRSRVIVTGQPRYDRLIPLVRSRTTRPGGSVVMFTTPFAVAGMGKDPQRAQERLAADLARALGSKGTRFFLKPHPQESSKPYERLVGRDTVADRKADPATFLAHADVAIIGISTLLEEAALLGCPVAVPGSIVHGTRFDGYLPPSEIYPRFESLGAGIELICTLSSTAGQGIASAQRKAVGDWVEFSTERPAARAVAAAIGLLIGLDRGPVSPRAHHRPYSRP